MRRILASVMLAAFVTTPLPAQLVQNGPEFAVNTYTTNSQAHPRLSIDPSGGFVVVWESYGQDGSGFGVIGRRYDSAGQPVGPEFQVNTYTTGNQLAPTVASDGAGNFVVVWSSLDQDGAGYGIFGRRFDSVGSPLGGEFQVNTYTTGSQSFEAVAMHESGEFVVVWTSEGQDGDGMGVFGRRFDAAGAPQGTEFQVNTHTTNDQFTEKAAIDMDAAGNFVVVWEGFGQDGSNGGVFGQRFDRLGNRRGSEFQANTYTTSRQRESTVGVDAWGNFVVVWNSFSQDGSSWGVYSQRFGADGTRRGGEFRINTATYSGQVSRSLDVDPAGNFVVVWYSFHQDGSGWGVFAQRYNALGATVGTEFQMNSYTTNDQSFPAVALGADGNSVMVWYSFGQDGSDLGVFGKRYNCSPPLPAIVSDVSVLPMNGGSDLRFAWSPAANATEYILLQDTRPDGIFDSQIGTAIGGVTEVTIPAPPGNMRYFLVAARNTCGLGPRR